MRDTTPVCDKCGMIAALDEDSTTEWIVRLLLKPCLCGGRFRPKCLLEVTNGGVCLD